MSFQNSISEDGYIYNNISSININVIPSFGHIVNVSESDKSKVVGRIWYRQYKLKNGEPQKEPFIANLKTLIHHDMLLSVWERSSKSQSTASTFTNTSRDQD